MATQKLCVLGSTGSIGTQALSLVEELGIEVTSISGYQNEALLEEQVLRFHPKFVCAVDESVAKSLSIKLASTNTKVLAGADALCYLAAEDGSDTVLTSVVGVAGLQPTITAIQAGKNIALANKETLVAGGRLVTDLAKQHDVSLLPVDSEHSAIFQCLQDRNSAPGLRRIFLTASGGPFYGYTAEQLEKVTLEDALRHPNWSMGRKITVDCATLMNKGFELIEAMWLFSLPPECVDITVHRQSIVHSMVEFEDGSVLAQLGLPDMRLPIQYALTYPERKPCPVEPLTIERMASLTFGRADEKVFRCLAACKKAAAMGGTAPCIANAANEAAVALFLDGRIRFQDISLAVERAIEEEEFLENYTLDDLLQIDRAVRRKTVSFLIGE